MGMRLLGRVATAAAAVGYLIYVLASGGALWGGGELNARRSQVVTCALGLNGSLPRGLAEQCAVLFTDPAGLITRLDSEHAIFIDLQVDKFDIGRLHQAVLSDAPEKLAGNTVFNVWWDSLPIGG